MKTKRWRLVLEVDGEQHGYLCDLEAGGLALVQGGVPLHTVEFRDGASETVLRLSRIRATDEDVAAWPGA